MKRDNNTNVSAFIPVFFCFRTFCFHIMRNKISVQDVNVNGTVVLSRLHKSVIKWYKYCTTWRKTYYAINTIDRELIIQSLSQAWKRSVAPFNNNIDTQQYVSFATYRTYYTPSVIKWKTESLCKLEIRDVARRELGGL